jgi:hypothetical protein
MTLGSSLGERPKTTGVMNMNPSLSGSGECYEFRSHYMSCGPSEVL